MIYPRLRGIPISGWVIPEEIASHYEAVKKE